MSKPIIEIENIGKCYKIGRQKGGYLSLREEMSKSVKGIVSRLKGSGAQTQEDFWALKDVSFSVQQGEAVGIIGRNGAGKSTLLKVLSQITPPTTGKITFRGRIASLLEVGTGFHPELTGRENIYLNGAILGMTRKEIQSKFDEIVAFSEVEKFLDTPVKRYSSGMYVRLAFAVAAHLEPEILVVDEVLAVGDAEFQKKCLGKMGEVASGGRTVLFVSHNMAAVRDLCRRAVVLNEGQIVKIGSSDDGIAYYLGSQSNNRAEFEGSSLRWAEIDAEGESIIIRGAFDHTVPLPLPNFGFQIRDAMGNPVVGGNAIRLGVEKSPYPMQSGIVEIELKDPKLRTGHYSLSVRFGDTLANFCEYQDCIGFDVTDKIVVRPEPVSRVGAAVPQCEFRFLETPAEAFVE